MDRLEFLRILKPGDDVLTPDGHAIVMSIIEDIGCHVNVILDSGVFKNYMLYQIYENK